MLNTKALTLFNDAASQPQQIGCRTSAIDGATVIDAGVESRGSLEAGIMLARLCLGDLADVSIAPADPDVYSCGNLIHVRTDQPLAACLGGQYAGWPVQTDNFFAMGSGPMRLLRGREEMLKSLGLSEDGDQCVGVLESDQLPDQAVIEKIAGECNVTPQGVHLAIARSTSIAGSLQVVARSIETAMHKLHELGFDVKSIVSATGHAPLPPPAKRGDMVGGIGRTNDAILYGATVTMWIDSKNSEDGKSDRGDDQIEQVADKVPSHSSQDYGRPFAEVFKSYEYDFYKVDPLLFSPARIILHNLNSGRTWVSGQLNPQVLRQSFLS